MGRLRLGAVRWTAQDELPVIEDQQVREIRGAGRKLADSHLALQFRETLSQERVDTRRVDLLTFAHADGGVREVHTQLVIKRARIRRMPFSHRS